jgi:hypothetical protein
LLREGMTEAQIGGRKYVGYEESTALLKKKEKV